MRPTSITALSNHELLAETARLAFAECQTTAQLIALLAEVDARALYLAEGYSSMFVYCTQVLRLSESAAYDRIEAARVSRQHPLVLEHLIAGTVTLTAVRLLAPHLTADNCEALVEAAHHKSKREVLHLVACIAPQPDLAPSVRRLSSPRPAEGTVTESLLGPTVQPTEPVPPIETDTPPSVLPPPTPASRPTVAPLAAERYLIKVTVSRDTHEKLRRAQDLLRHTLPSGDPAAIVDCALTVLVEQLERRRVAKSGRPRSKAVSAADTRRVPANVKRLVWERDAGRCAFIGTQGRCPETGRLEFHHLVPYAAGGVTSVENLALRCRSHNTYEAVQYFGGTRAGTSLFRRAKGAGRRGVDRPGGLLASE
jgi:hypothetical protein